MASDEVTQKGFMMNNPFEMGKTMFEAWEKSMGDVVEKLTRDENFIKGMSTAMSGSLDMKNRMETHLETYLKTINMPTKSDIERMLSYLQRIEAKLLDIEDSLEESLAVRKATLNPPQSNAKALDASVHAPKAAASGKTVKPAPSNKVPAGKAAPQKMAKKKASSR